MAHFAKLDENNIVIEVHGLNNNELIDDNGIEQESKGIDFLVNWSGGYTKWKQTSYNANFRKNYAGIGYFYDETKDAFIPPQPYPSWLLNENSYQWEAPIAIPTDDGLYSWDEANTLWVAYES
jgi:hypothetical protein